MEAEAILGVLERVEAGTVELISSTVLELEISRNPLTIRREHGEQVLNRALSFVLIDEPKERRAEEFTRRGIKAMDALHLAAAEGANADYFCTCDDRFLRRAKSFSDLETIVVSPLELIRIIES